MASKQPEAVTKSRTGVLVFLREIPTAPGDPVSHFWGGLERTSGTSPSASPGA